MNPSGFYSKTEDTLASTRNILVKVHQRRAKKRLKVLTAAMPSTLRAQRSAHPKTSPISHGIKKKKFPSGKSNEKTRKNQLDEIKVKLEMEEEETKTAARSYLDMSSSTTSISSSTTDISTTPPTPSNMSEYELKIQQNIQKRLEILSSLKLEEAKENLFELLPSSKLSATVSERGLSRMKRKRSPRSPVVQRKSQRLLQKPPDTPPKDYIIPTASDLQDHRERPAAGEKIIHYLNEKLDGNECSEMLAYCQSVTEVPSSSPNWIGSLKDVLHNVKQLVVTQDTVAKVVPKRITCMALHPSNSDDILFVGDKEGYLGIWLVDRSDSTDGAWSFRIHGSGIPCMSVDSFSSGRVITTSYDGSTRATDLQRLVVDDVYSRPQERRQDYLTWHSQVDANLLLVSAGTGDVTFVDMREAPSSAKSNKLDPMSKSIKVVAAHPTATQYSVTSNNMGEVKLWDHRKLNHKSAVCCFKHPRSASSIRFSPNTGNTLLTTCHDDKIRLIQLENFSAFKEEWSVEHNNQTGRWLTTHKADFMPGREDSFVVGSLNPERIIEVWRTGGSSPVVALKGDAMTTFSSTVCCHPSRFVVAGGNSSGKCHVFR